MAARGLTTHNLRVMPDAKPEKPKPTRRERLRGFVRDGVFVVLALVAIHLFQTRNLTSGHAPPFTRASLGGANVTVPMAGRPHTVVHFFATWCGVCKLEEPNVVALAEAGDVLLVASASGTPDEVTRYARAHGLTMPIVVDADGALARAYGVRAFPTTFFVDEGGEIDFSVVGYTTELGLRTRRFFTR
jgi:thiol-disulfide isomerase/thioredoxin